MKKRKVISLNNLPVKLPLFQTLVTWIALDYWNAPQWLYGALGLLFLVVWIYAIVARVNQEETDISKILKK
ncbi:hypothetical protein [Sunxiuqinia sp. sy24]|uniref:hypothetical protein n=1 Tax=Sunxiuqinia sp. sy24 TaxID=3461495 RepID=UPI00404617BE